MRARIDEMILGYDCLSVCNWISKVSLDSLIVICMFGWNFYGKCVPFPSSL